LNHLNQLLFIKGEKFLPILDDTLMLVVSSTRKKSKCGAELITESTAVMTNDIIEETTGYILTNQPVLPMAIIYHVIQ